MITNLKVRFALATATAPGIGALAALVAYLIPRVSSLAGFALDFVLAVATLLAVNAVLELTWPTFYTVESRRGRCEVRRAYRFLGNAVAAADELTSLARLRAAGVEYHVYKALPGVPVEEVLSAGRRVH